MGHPAIFAHTNTLTITPCPACGRKNRLPVSAPGVPRCAACHRNLPWLVEAADAGFDDAIETRLPVLVDLWAPWCGPCRLIAPAVDRVAAALAGHLKVVKVNVDEAPEVAARFGVQSVPTLLIVRDGREITRQVGALPAERLIDWTVAAVTG
jgi:thioredoxin 2